MIDSETLATTKVSRREFLKLGAAGLVGATLLGATIAALHVYIPEGSSNRLLFCR